jgi:hypothetical protein
VVSLDLRGPGAGAGAEAEAEATVGAGTGAGGDAAGELAELETESMSDEALFFFVDFFLLYSPAL